MNYLNKGLHWFKMQNRPRQLTLITGLLLIILLTLFLCYWLKAARYAVLFNNLDNRDANQIIHHLEEANISYRLHNQGSDILIDKNLVDKTRLKLMSSDMQLSGSVGFELFDKSDFGLTDFSQKINFQRALQGELERTISSLDEIKQARVHLVIPEQHLFQQEENQPRAAINLHLARPLTPAQVRGIQQLVSASVAHMQKSNVVLIDQSGNSLTQGDDDLGTTHFAMKKNLERYFNDKVLQILKPIFKDEEFMVKIDVSLNYDELQRESSNPQPDGVLTHEKEIQHSTSTKTEKTQTNRDLTHEKSYQFGTKKERFTHAGGTIERLTISVVVPQLTDKKTLIKIERLVKSVVGFEAKRGDSISIEALVNEHLPSIIPVIPQSLHNFSNNSHYLLGLNLLGPLFFFFHFKRRKNNQKRQLLLNDLNLWLNQHD